MKIKLSKFPRYMKERFMINDDRKFKKVLQKYEGKIQKSVWDIKLKTSSNTLFN